jgi:DNA-binding MarR family transcriptional regulator
MALSKEQNEAWRSLVLVTHVLDDALDRQSQRDGGLPHAYYKVLVFLYESPGQRLTMSELAAQQRYSSSRMTHAVASMEASGWVRRTRSEHDRRVRFVELTEDGIALVRAVSPRQVVDVREKAFSRLDPIQVSQLAAISLALVEGLDGPHAGGAIADDDGD